MVGKPLSQAGVRHQQLKIQMQPRNAFRSCTSKSEPANETPCSPISQISDTLLPVTTTATEIVVFKENYYQPAFS